MEIDTDLTTEKIGTFLIQNQDLETRVVIYQGATSYLVPISRIEVVEDTEGNEVLAIYPETEDYDRGLNE